jgi:hypothetical protein
MGGRESLSVVDRRMLVTVYSIFIRMSVPPETSSDMAQFWCSSSLTTVHGWYFFIYFFGLGGNVDRGSTR